MLTSRMVPPTDKPLILDIGGEGRHPAAWNLNPSSVRTIGPGRGQPIPRRLAGRADAIPLPDGSVDEIIVERTPLPHAALLEIRRVLAAGGVLTLRHAVPPCIDPHAAARSLLALEGETSQIALAGRVLQQTRFVLA
jgi:hypothetical protein